MRRMGIDVAVLLTHGSPEDMSVLSKYATELGFGTKIQCISKLYWKSIIDAVESDIYYFDEPFANYVESGNCTYQEAYNDIIEKALYIKSVRPNSKLYIGDIRHILEDEFEITQFPDNVFYTYTSYTSTVFWFGKPIKFGWPYQGNTWKKLHGKVGDRFDLVWIYGKTKIFCFGDEYKRLQKKCNELNIKNVLYYRGNYNWVDKLLHWFNKSWPIKLRDLHYNRFKKYFK